jgi:chemotaxis protein CheD
MTAVVVGVADCRLSKAKDEMLVTCALGSCLAVMLHDPVAGVGGLLHYMLPDSAIDPSKAARNPYLFADTGIPLLLKHAFQMGAQKQRLVVRVAGAAQVMDGEDVVHVGRRNYLALREIFARLGVRIQGEAVGGTVSRTVGLEVGTGRVWLRTPEAAGVRAPVTL